MCKNVYYNCVVALDVHLVVNIQWSLKFLAGYTNEWTGSHTNMFSQFDSISDYVPVIRYIDKTSEYFIIKMQSNKIKCVTKIL